MRILKEEFAIDCSLSSTYRLRHRIKLSWLAARPRHPRADATAQGAPVEAMLHGDDLEGASAVQGPPLTRPDLINPLVRSFLRLEHWRRSDPADARVR